VINVRLVVLFVSLVATSALTSALHRPNDLLP